MTPSKETLEAPSVAGNTAPPAAPKPDLNKMRADAVSLDVPVRVHGSKVTEVVRGVTPHTEPFEEEASTMIVFPHGGVVRMLTVVNVGQMLVVTNLRTSQDAICRVVKVRAYSNSQAYVEVEFTHRQPGYWGVHFPTDDDESMLGAAPTAAQPTAEPEKKAPVISSVTVKVEPMPKIPSAPPRTESAFAPIGSQEEVQPPATHTESRARSMPPAAVAPPTQASQTFASHAPSAAVRSVASHELIDEGAEISERETDFAPARSSRAFGTLTGGTGRAAATSSDFGARLDSGVSAQPHIAAAQGSNWMWMAACAFFLVAGLAAGALYFRQHSTASPQQATQTSVTSQAVQQSPAAPSVQPSVQQDFGEPVANASVAMDPTPAVTERPSRSEPETRIASNLSNREAKSFAPAAPIQSAKNFTASAARPVARAIESSRVAAAPTVSTPVVSAALPDVLSSPDAALPAPPPGQPLTRVRVGGVIVQPKLMHTVAPNYPTAARQSGIYGNVVISAQVDKAGNVASMNVVSGPATLQSAAMSALRLWKYQPATLDGVPIATDITVTIKFQQQ